MFLSLDYDPDIFIHFMKFKPILRINDFYLLIPYLFNINLYIKIKLLKFQIEVDFCYIKNYLYILFK